MKRTKETFYKEHPQAPEREGISGCKDFDGEDLEYDARNKYLKQQQKEWLKQQMLEKESKKHAEKEEENAYATQTLELNRMRGMLQDDFSTKKTEIKNSVKDENLVLAQEKRERERLERLNKIREEQEEVRQLMERGRKKPFSQTSQH
eukprot:TRINITY_DN702_c0_g1_i4.p1 TRINITY_DN702_c0_g1~~TRINITY_DN702_c0_g1_i4.p1  ORF type:complete len:148 (-),score=50.55 TRINITY_DN702_c0_g1_i4:113-556(-)